METFRDIATYQSLLDMSLKTGISIYAVMESAVHYGGLSPKAVLGYARAQLNSPTLNPGMKACLTEHILNFSDQHTQPQGGSHIQRTLADSTETLDVKAETE
ncbi:MAG: hypothetical protein V1659_04280 [Candidatus Woesearchaeota archaeon]